MPLYDFACECGFSDEFICDSSVKTQECPKCKKEMKRTLSNRCAKVLNTIVPSYPGAKKHKAGYQHTHSDKPATRIQSGYGGIQAPKD